MKLLFIVRRVTNALDIGMAFSLMSLGPEKTDFISVEVSFWEKLFCIEVSLLFFYSCTWNVLMAAEWCQWPLS